MIKVEEYLDVRKRAKELDFNIPESVAILPRNFESAKSKEELVHEETTPTIRILWKQSNVIETPLEKEGEKIPFVTEKYLEWIGPLIFFASTAIIQNPTMIDIAIGVISNYLTDFFKGMIKDEKKVKLKVVVETKYGSYKKVEFEGPSEGLKELPRIVRSLHDEQ